MNTYGADANQCCVFLIPSVSVLEFCKCRCLVYLPLPAMVQLLHRKLWYLISTNVSSVIIIKKNPYAFKDRWGIFFSTTGIYIFSSVLKKIPHRSLNLFKGITHP